MNIVLSVCLLLCVLHLCFIPLHGAKSSKSSSKEDDAFLKEFKKFMKDPKALQETYAQLQNPESLQQVQAMMRDPSFLSEVNRLKSNPLYKDALASVQEMYSDPAKAAKFLSAMSAARRDEMSTAQLGMSELSKVAKNPKLMAEALEDLKNPEIAAEVQKLMKDPSFVKEMKAYTSSPEFQATMARAQVNMESLAEDPQAMAKMMEKMSQLMGKSDEKDF